ncbi:MAG: hypothetical protein IJZ13_07220 [Clostridia bacterium]|nr:hypothetical protein [Clostridia bacterium]
MAEQMKQTETPLFVATCVHTKATWRAIYQIQLRPTLWVMCILLVAELVFVVVDTLAGGSFPSSLVIMLLCPFNIVMLTLPAWLSDQYAARQCAAAQTLFGRERTTRVWFYADRLLQVEYPTGGQVTLRYDLIRRVELTPTLVILRLPNGVYLPVGRGQFEYGDGRLFVPFLQQQNPHLVVRGR